MTDAVWIIGIFAVAALGLLASWIVTLYESLWAHRRVVALLNEQLDFRRQICHDYYEMAVDYRNRLRDKERADGERTDS